MNFRSPIRLLATTFATLAALFSTSWAQAPSPQPRAAVIVSGTVRDSAGMPIADAFVLFEEKATAASIDARTAADGTYSFLALRAGTYIVRAHKEKFRDATSGPLELSLGQRKQVDLVLATPKPLANTKKPSK
jgi:Carboxypeptidase regulatory-like domain